MIEPFKLIEILKGHKVYIQTHNFPDPDAIASAYGLQKLLEQHGVPADICYDGRIEKLSTSKMFEVFAIQMKDRNEISDMTEKDYIVTVDSQKYNSNLTDFIGDEVACIDHHPTVFACEYLYKDVRITGACASLIAEYYKITDTPMPKLVASALAYGIKMDTADFTRGATEFDAAMFAYVFEKADKDKIRQMYKDVMEMDDLKAYAAAIDTIHIYENIGFSQIPFDCPDAMIAIISDFILALDVVEVSIVYATRSDGIKFSVRSEITDFVDAGKLTRQALEGVGSGGGHKTMAGGFIPKENQSKLTDTMLEERFIEAIEEQMKSTSV